MLPVIGPQSFHQLKMFELVENRLYTYEQMTPHYWQLNCSVVLPGEENKLSVLSHMLKGEEWATGRSAYDYDCNPEFPLMDGFGS